MNASNRNKRAVMPALLAIALLSPTAWAQGVVAGDKGPPTQQPLPTQGTAAQHIPERTMREIERTSNEAPPPSPPQSQGAEHAATHSSVVQRDLWVRLDADGDGRISSSEGAADAGFNAGFAGYDADSDGFVTETEFRTAAKAEMEAGRGGADAGSSTKAGMGDPMRRLDANADGSLSVSEGEADATIKANFAAIDSNSDGMVTRAEYHAWLKAGRR